MFGNFGFSYVGLAFVLALIIPNLIWTKNQPKDYSPENENKFLLLLEKIGEVLTTVCLLIFKDFNFHKTNIRSIFFFAAVILMTFYEIWWAGYFKSEKRLSDFYSGFLGIPLAGATLPVISAFLLSIYSENIWLMISSVILGIGHIGIHIGHLKEVKR